MGIESFFVAKGLSVVTSDIHELVSTAQTTVLIVEDFFTRRNTVPSKLKTYIASLRVHY